MIKRRLLLAAAPALAFPRTWAQLPANWPTRPVRIVVPLPPGGSYDYLARALAEPIGQRLGQPVVVENRSGADGRIGVGHVARQPGDGYTLGIISVTNVIHPSLFKEIPYDILKDFEPVGIVAHAPFVLVAGPSLTGPATAKEYVEMARQRPGFITFGSSGVGSPFHLGGELLKSILGLDMLHVAYKGTGPLLNALLSGEVHSAIVPVGPYLSHIRSGKLRPLGALTDKHIGSLPQVPTLNDLLGQTQLSMISWLGLVAPAGTPRMIVERINSELRATIADPAFLRDKLAVQSYEIMDPSPSAMARVMRNDLNRYAEIVRSAKIPAE
jgi:tripartite-type tricarboxylate transporter receptor subunit TctC